MLMKCTRVGISKIPVNTNYQNTKRQINFKIQFLKFVNHPFIHVFEIGFFELVLI